jgi:hypothetical protein
VVTYISPAVAAGQGGARSGQQIDYSITNPTYNPAPTQSGGSGVQAGIIVNGVSIPATGGGNVLAGYNPATGLNYPITPEVRANLTQEQLQQVNNQAAIQNFQTQQAQQQQVSLVQMVAPGQYAAPFNQPVDVLGQQLSVSSYTGLPLATVKENWLTGEKFGAKYAKEEAIFAPKATVSSDIAVGTKTLITSSKFTPSETSPQSKFVIASDINFNPPKETKLTGTQAAAKTGIEIETFFKNVGKSYGDVPFIPYPKAFRVAQGEFVGGMVGGTVAAGYKIFFPPTPTLSSDYVLSTPKSDILTYGLDVGTLGISLGVGAKVFGTPNTEIKAGTVSFYDIGATPKTAFVPSKQQTFGYSEGEVTKGFQITEGNYVTSVSGSKVFEQPVSIKTTFTQTPITEIPKFVNKVPSSEIMGGVKTTSTTETRLYGFGDKLEFSKKPALYTSSVTSGTENQFIGVGRATDIFAVKEPSVRYPVYTEAQPTRYFDVGYSTAGERSIPIKDFAVGRTIGGETQFSTESVSGRLVGGVSQSTSPLTEKGQFIRGYNIGENLKPSGTFEIFRKGESPNLLPFTSEQIPSLSSVAGTKAPARIVSLSPQQSPEIIGGSGQAQVQVMNARTNFVPSSNFQMPRVSSVTATEEISLTQFAFPKGLNLQEITKTSDRQFSPVISIQTTSIVPRQREVSPIMQFTPEKQTPITTFKQTPYQPQLPFIGTIPAQIQPPKTIQPPIQSTPQITRQPPTVTFPLPPSTPSIPVSPKFKVPEMPPLRFSGLPPFKDQSGGVPFFGESRRFKKQKFKYTPDIISNISGITRRLPKGVLSSSTALTGLEIRPISKIGGGKVRVPKATRTGKMKLGGSLKMPKGTKGFKFPKMKGFKKIKFGG